MSNAGSKFAIYDNKKWNLDFCLTDGIGPRAGLFQQKFHQQRF